MHASNETRAQGGLARYCVEHREVAWLFLAAALAWGVWSYRQLPQQEDPSIPIRMACLVTRFAGADAAQVEELITKKLEQKITELATVDETRSVSRTGISVIYIQLLQQSQIKLDQEWNKIRAKMQEVELPEGASAPFLDTDFGNTITLLYAITSANTTRAEALARADLIRQALATLRKTSPSAQGRAAAIFRFPYAFAPAYRAELVQRFQQYLLQTRSGTDCRSHYLSSMAVVDFAAGLPRAQLENVLADFKVRLLGSDGEFHPDFPPLLLIDGNENPLDCLLAEPVPIQTYRQLEKIAETLRDELKLMPAVGKAALNGAVPETIYLTYGMRAMPGYDIEPEAARNYVSVRNMILPGGILRADGQNFPINISGSFHSEADLNNVIIGTGGKDRSPVYLRDVFSVQRGYMNPITYCVNILQRPATNAPLENRRAVLLAVEMKEGAIISRFDDAMTRTIRNFSRHLPPGVAIAKISDQPRSVETRINQFSQCFIEAVAVVIIVALFLMNWRSAIVVALAIPLTVCITLGGMHLLNIPLHQISIAALIIALGMLVDDPVVASDAINRELHHGQPRETAAWFGPYRLRHAILYATLINIAAFLPLVFLPGDTGDFIYALPIVVTLALVASRIVSMTFIPLLGYYLLKGQKGLEEGGEIRSFFLFRPVDLALTALLPRYKKLLTFALRHAFVAVLICYALLAASFGLTPFFGTQFFPAAERNQALLDIELPKSASIHQTRAVCARIVRILENRKEIESAAVFLGGTAPRFYYNVETQEPAEYLAQILINTWSDKDIDTLMKELRPIVDRETVGARCILKQLEQGPAVDAPIQIRLSGPDLNTLRELADQTAGALRAAGGYKVTDDMGLKVPALEIRINQDKANRLGVVNPAIGEVARTAFSDYPITELREGDHTIPVLVRLRDEERNEADKIKSLYVHTRLGQAIPLESIARVTVSMDFPVISHFNKLRTITVKSYAPFGILPSALLAKAGPAITAIPLPPNYRLEFAGEDKEIRNSQNELVQVLIISMVAIMLTMVMQFRSVIKSLTVMLTVPLGLIGAFIGLAIMHAAFGFIAFLAIVSLAGVIVSHIIVLSDFIEEARAKGMDLQTALVQAGLVRLRAVIVTVLATVGGLIPLAIGGGALWKPLTAVHIFGLLFATALTLVLLPVLYYIFCAKLKLFK